MVSIKKLFTLSTWTRVMPGIKDAFIRFPLPVICVIGASLIGLLAVHDVKFASREIAGKSLVSLIYGAIALTSLKLFGESKNWALSKHALAALAVMTVVVYYVSLVFDKFLFSPSVYFVSALLLSLLFVPYINRQSDQASVWFFNYQTGVAVFFAGLASLVLGMGIYIILSSLHYLFDIKIPSRTYGDVWILCTGVLFPIYVLANISRQFDFEATSCGFPKGVRFITNYILLPLMVVYMAILYAYFGRIIIQWELPRGNLTWMIAVFGSVGIVTKLLAYPIRNDGTRLLAWFDKYYYFALLVPIILLAIAIGVRIHDYGITEKRYTIVLMGVWFASVALLTIFKKDRVHIKYVPMILAGLLLVGSYGPWGAVQVSTNSQVNRFESFLTNHQLLHNGQVVMAKAEMPYEQRKILSSIADYLCANEQRYKRIQPWFTSLIAQSGKKEYKSRKWLSSMELVKLMGISYVNRWQVVENLERFEYNSQLFDFNRTLVDVSGFDYIGHGSITRYSDSYSKTTFVLKHMGKQENITFGQSGEGYIVETEAGDRVRFDIAGLIRSLREQHITTLTQADKDKLTLMGNSRSGRLKARLILERISGSMSEKHAINITNLQYLLLLKFNDS